MSDNSISIKIKRAIRVMKTLKGRSLNGLSNKELSKALGESPANFNHTPNTLTSEGMAQRLDNGRYSPGNAFLYCPGIF